VLQQGNTLAKVIESNTGITNLQPDVFKFTASISGSVVSRGNVAHAHASLQKGISGVTVNLEDSDGNVLATTQTDKLGDYTFNQLDGVSGTGSYIVSVVAPSGTTQISINPSPILVSRGDINVKKVDFVLAPA
jgi:peroxidase